MSEQEKGLMLQLINVAAMFVAARDDGDNEDDTIDPMARIALRQAKKMGYNTEAHFG